MKKGACLVLISIVLLISFLSSWNFLKRDSTPLVYDQFTYYEMALLNSNSFFGKHYNIQECVGKANQYRPPLFPFTSSLFFLFVNASEDTTKISNYLFLILLIFSLIKIELLLKKGVYSHTLFSYLDFFALF